MSYIGNQPGGLGKAERFIFTATGTTPTITHDTDGVPISYTVGQCSVYLNGVKQVIPTDVAASNGSTLVFAADLVVGDVVECVALSTFSAAAIDSGSIVSGAIDLAHMSSESVDEDNLHISNAGSNGQFLSKQSGNTGGLTWADAGGGKILQTVQTLYRDIVSFTAEPAGTMTNYGDSRTGYDATVLDSTITPSATSSKILIMTSILVGLSTSSYSTLKLKRGIDGSTPSFDGSASGWAAGDTPANWHNDRSSTPGAGTNAGAQCFYANSTPGYDPVVINWYYLDSPAVADVPVVYRFNLSINSGAASKTGFINMTAYNANDFGASSGISTIILQEISA